MKALPELLIFTAILAAIAGCGKGNESGRNTRGACNSWGTNGQCIGYSTNGFSTGFLPNITNNGVNLRQVEQENPCILGGGPRQVIQQQVQVDTGNGQPTIVTQGDLYVGVTAMGDVAAIIGNGTMNPQFVASLCPRPMSGQGTIYPRIIVGDSTVCAFKYITVANIGFPDGTQANFRSLNGGNGIPGGSSMHQKFSFCLR